MKRSSCGDVHDNRTPPEGSALARFGYSRRLPRQLMPVWTRHKGLSLDASLETGCRGEGPRAVGTYAL